MAKKPKVILEKPKYMNIPVTPETYAKVALVSEARGFGERGKGAFIDHLVSQELPECEHEKRPVQIEYFNTPNTVLGGTPRFRTAYLCETCRRVYAKISQEDLALEDGEKLLKAVKG